MHHTVKTKLRFVLVHYHLFKNAGTTLEFILEKNFSGRLAYLNGELHSSTVTGEDLLQFLADNHDVKAISSHHLRPPGPETQNIVFFDVIFLRHPLDRLLSMYDFYRRSEGAGDPLEQHAKRLERGPFLEFVVDRYPHLANDVQVNWLASGGRYTRPPDESDLEKATGLMKKAALPGLVELFDTSLVAAEYYLCPAFQKLDFSYVPQNVTPGRRPQLRDRLQVLRQASGRRLYAQLLRMNQLDLKLVERVANEVQRRFRLVPNHEARFQDFLSRCGRHAAH